MNQLKNKTALVFGEDARSFLTVIRSLHQAGMIVDVVCFSNTSVALKSNYINKKYGLNHQAMTVEEWREEVEKIILSNHYDIIIPCDERALFPLMDIKDNISTGTAFAVPERNILGPLFDKVETRQIAELCDIAVAKGERLNISNTSYSHLCQKFNLPLVLKPTQSYDEEDLNKRQSVKIAHNEQHFLEFQQDHANQQCLVESYFTGYGIGVSILAENGKVKVAFAHARVSEPETGGGSSYRKAITIEPTMLYACQKFCMHLEYTGVAMFEFKYSAKTTDWILIEVNARFWGSLPLAVFAGVDFPAMYAHVLLEKYTPDCLTYNQSAYARNFSADIYDMMGEYDSLKQKKGSLRAISQLSKRVLSFGRLLTTNESLDSFTWQDQKPFWFEFYYLFKDKLHKLPVIREHRKKTRVAQFEQQLTKHTNNILFVCYGNIMRSPFAGKLFEQKIKGTTLANIKVDSFGFHQIENRKAKPQCIKMAKKWHVNIEEHRSKWLSRKDCLTENTLLVILDKKNEWLLQSYYPEINHISLADLVPKSMGFYHEIKDPYDMPSDYLEKSYQLIDASIDELIRIMTKMT